MATKRKKKPGLVMVGVLVPKAVAEALRSIAGEQDRSVSKTVKKLIEDSPDVQKALKQVQAA